MRKERLAYFRKCLLEKQRQLTEEVGRTAIYGKDQEDDSIKDLGDQANTAYNREFFFELGNGDRRLLRDVVSALQKMDDGGVGSCRGCGGPIAAKRPRAPPVARARARSRAGPSGSGRRPRRAAAGRSPSGAPRGPRRRSSPRASWTARCRRESSR